MFFIKKIWIYNSIVILWSCTHILYVMCKLWGCGKSEGEGGVLVTHCRNVKPHRTLNMSIQVFLSSISLPRSLIPRTYRSHDRSHDQGTNMYMIAQYHSTHKNVNTTLDWIWIRFTCDRSSVVLDFTITITAAV